MSSILVSWWCHFWCHFGVTIWCYYLVLPFWCQAPLKDICPPVEDTSVDECQAPDGRK
ncbi:hypothetical protein ACSU6B_10605 [Neobacillus sp. C211]|uniref:hypothetical protein n=1 Tax=unclassified Neobacillus TaxID=2675272 RepID=UPI003977E820